MRLKPQVLKSRVKMVYYHSWKLTQLWFLRAKFMVSSILVSLCHAMPQLASATLPLLCLMIRSLHLPHLQCFATAFSLTWWLHVPSTAKWQTHDPASHAGSQTGQQSSLQGYLLLLLLASRCWELPPQNMAWCHAELVRHFTSLTWPLPSMELEPLLFLTVWCPTPYGSSNLQSLSLVYQFGFVSYLYDLFMQ